MNDVPFDFLSRKWVKLLKIAFDEAEKYGKNPEKFNISAFYIRANPELGDKFTVVINAENLQFIEIRIGRD